MSEDCFYSSSVQAVLSYTLDKLHNWYLAESHNATVWLTVVVVVGFHIAQASFIDNVLIFLNLSIGLCWSWYLQHGISVLTHSLKLHSLQWRSYMPFYFVPFIHMQPQTGTMFIVWYS